MAYRVQQRTADPELLVELAAPLVVDLVPVELALGPR